MSQQYTFQNITIRGAEGNVTVGGINDFGEISGSYTAGNGTDPNADPYPQAFTDTNGGITVYGAGGAPYGQHSIGGAINNEGQVVGSSGHYEETARGFLYSGGTFTEIDGPGNEYFTRALGVNDRGQVVGNMAPTTSAGASQGYVWSGGGATAISYPGSTSTYATGINDNGQIVGYYSTPNRYGYTQYHGFLEFHGYMTPINVPGAVSTQVEAISNAGEVVGTYFDGQHYHGFIDQINQGGRMTFINAPGSADTWIHSVNDLGQVAGAYDISSSGPTTGFVATPGDTHNLMADFNAMLPQQVAQVIGRSSGHAYFDPTVHPVVVAAAHG